MRGYIKKFTILHKGKLHKGNFNIEMKGIEILEIKKIP